MFSSAIFCPEQEPREKRAQRELKEVDQAVFIRDRPVAPPKQQTPSADKDLPLCVWQLAWDEPEFLIIRKLQNIAHYVIMMPPIIALCTSCLCRRYSTVSRGVTYLKSITEQLTGHSDVLVVQKLVKQRKEELRRWRNELQEVSTTYEKVQQRLKNLYTRKTQVYQEHKRDVLALQAINNEEETLLFQEQTLSSKLEECKQSERECFESLSDAIQDSHERERAQSEKMKYYSRLGSVLGALLGFLGSNVFLRREVRKHNQTQAEKMNHLENFLQDLQTHWKSKADGKAADRLEGFQKNIEACDHTLAALGSSLHNMEGSLKSLELRIERAIASAESQRKMFGASSQDSSSEVLGGRNVSDSGLQVLGVVSFAVIAALLINMYTN